MIFIYHYPEKGTCDSKKQAWCCAGMEICRNPSANMFFAALISISKVNSTAKMKKEAVPMISHFLPFWQLYSTKRYRSNLINWGLLPLRTDEPLNLPVGTYLLIPDVQMIVESGKKEFYVEILDSQSESAESAILCTLDTLIEDEKKILLSGCLINYYKN